MKRSQYLYLEGKRFKAEALTLADPFAAARGKTAPLQKYWRPAGIGAIQTTKLNNKALLAGAALTLLSIALSQTALIPALIILTAGALPAIITGLFGSRWSPESRNPFLLPEPPGIPPSRVGHSIPQEAVVAAARYRDCMEAGEKEDAQQYREEYRNLVAETCLAQFGTEQQKTDSVLYNWSKKVREHIRGDTASTIENQP